MSGSQKVFLSVGMLLTGMFFLMEHGYCQPVPPVGQLQDYSRGNAPSGYSPNLKTLTFRPKGNLHYLFPFYHAFKDEEKFRKIYSDRGYYYELSEYFAFAGDYLSSMQFLEKSYDSIDDATRRKIYRTADGLKDITHADARHFIRFAAKSHQVIMLNESSNNPFHRAFVISLLSDLYKQGFHYLAMEMLNNFSNHSLTRLDLSTGYYTAEPMAGELVREALGIGYRLISYEDTAAAGHSPTQRDSIQAGNIYKVIQQDPNARILVLGEQDHISKMAMADGYIPMGLAFKKISGIDPFTIDQTEMTEESNLGYSRVIYQAYLQKYPIKFPSVAMSGNQPIRITNNDAYDISVIHPPSVYQDGRPVWYNLEGRRKPTIIKSVSPGVFLVQAYYQDELEKNGNKPLQLVPADQTYLKIGNKNYLLFLKPGKYTVLFRDINYHLLQSLAVEVS